MKDAEKFEIILNQWRDAGIEKGDTVLLHASSKRTLEKWDCSPKFLLQTFIEAVGSKGTLMLPTFNFDWNDVTHRFDIRNTPSHMGALSEAGRKHPFAVRTGHPVYSFAVIGQYADMFEGLDNHQGYGKDSPFQMLRDMDGKIAVLDLPAVKSMTFYHHVEEIEEVDYKFYKEFSGRYTDINGKTETRTYGLYVRNFDMNVKTLLDPLDELLWNREVYSGCRPMEGHGLRVASARSVYNYTSRIIEEGKARGMLYYVEGEDEFKFWEEKK